MDTSRKYHTMVNTLEFDSGGLSSNSQQILESHQYIDKFGDEFQLLFDARDEFSIYNSHHADDVCIF